MRVLLVNNLKAGHISTDLYDFIRAFSQDGDEVVMRTTDTTTPVEDLLDGAENFDAVVASGGDGTISSIAYALRNTQIPIMPFPSGTSNLLTLNLDYPIEPRAYANMLRKCETLDFDIGEATFAGRTRGFGLIAGAGFDATIMEDAKTLKPQVGESAYFIAAISKPNPTVSHFMLDIDGKRRETDGIAVLIANFSKMQFDVPITHSNNARDGLFEVMVIKSRNTLQLVPVLISAMLDRDGKWPSRSELADTYYAREVHVEAVPALTIQYDGEPTHLKTPLHARILPRSMRLVVDTSSAVIKRLIDS